MRIGIRTPKAVLLEDRRQDLITSLHRDIDALFEKIKDAVADATLPRRGWVDTLRQWWWDWRYGQKNPDHPLYRTKWNSSQKPTVATEWMSRRPSLDEYAALNDYLADFADSINEDRQTVIDGMLDQFKQRLKDMVTSKVAAMNIEDMAGMDRPAAPTEEPAAPPRPEAPVPRPAAPAPSAPPVAPGPEVDEPEPSGDEEPARKIGNVGGDSPAPGSSSSADPLHAAAERLMSGEQPQNLTDDAESKTLAELGPDEFPRSFDLKDNMVLLALRADPEGLDPDNFPVAAIPDFDDTQKQHYIDQFYIWAASKGVRGKGMVSPDSPAAKAPVAATSPDDGGGRSVGSLGGGAPPRSEPEPPPVNAEDKKIEYGFNVADLLKGKSTPTGKEVVDKVAKGEIKIDEVTPNSKWEKMLINRDFVSFKDFLKMVRALDEGLALNYYMVVATHAAKEGEERKTFFAKHRYSEVGTSRSTRTSRGRVLAALRERKSLLPGSRYQPNYGEIKGEKGDWVSSDTFYRFLGESTIAGKARRLVELLRDENRPPRVVSNGMRLNERVEVYKETLRSRIASNLLSQMR